MKPLFSSLSNEGTSTLKQELFEKIHQITEQNLMDIETHKEKGNHVIGFYCLYGRSTGTVAGCHE